jgi:hypothetical protein
MRTASGTRPRTRARRVLAVMAAATAWLGLSLVAATPGWADPASAVMRDDVVCEDGGVVKAHPPINVTSSVQEDIARWRPTLAVWDGTDWAEYARPQTDPGYAYILPGGLNQGLNPGWRSSTTHGQLLFHPFGGLPPGEYAVFHEVVLEQDGTTFTHWSAQTCSFS